MKVVIKLALFALILSSCRTPKIITKEKVVVDSTAIHQRDSIASLWAAESRAMEEEKRLWAEYGVLFEEEKPCISKEEMEFLMQVCANKAPFAIDADSLKNVMVYADKKPNKVRVNADGSLEVEGRIRAFNAQVATYQKEKDSLVRNLRIEKRVTDSLKVELSKKTSTVAKETKSNWLFLLLIGLFSGAAIWHNRKHILKLITKI